MARMAGEKGLVWAVDIQEEMLGLAGKAAEKEGVLPRIRFHRGKGNSLDLDLPPVFSFVLVFHVLHETADQEKILGDIFRILGPGGLLLLAEPKGIIGEKEFQNSIELALKAGFAMKDQPSILLSRAVLLEKAQRP